ncbi:MAG TPA: ABC transporter permease [Methanosarcinaceae archaeon]|nr:ABC transporter permease [Methanosarcinaceae archaeon]
MKKYIAKRLAIAVIVMLGASLLSFLLLYFAPGNPAHAILTAQLGHDPSLEEVAFFMMKHDLNNPFLVQCSQWLYMITHLNLGTSFRTGEPVLMEFLDRFPATFELAFTSMLIALLIAIPVGILSALKQNSILDHSSRLVALCGVSMPNFWLGLVLIMFFSLKLGWFPCFGYGTASHLVLPAITLGTGLAAPLMRLMRASMLEVLRQDYIRTARSKGLSEHLVMWKHGLKNALIPVITHMGMQTGHLLGGAVIVETIFAWPGVGKFLVDGIYARDYPVIQGFVLVIALFFVLSNLAVDILYTYLDPRIRYDVENKK